MTATLAQVAMWRKAHQNIEVPEAALVTAGPFPSLYANDFCVYLQSRGAEEQIATYVRDLGREIAWVYGNWQQASRNADRGALLADMMVNASAVGEAAHQYDFVRRFIQDYAAANGIRLPNLGSEPSTPWMDILPPGTDMAASGIVKEAT